MRKKSWRSLGSAAVAMTILLTLASSAEAKKKKKVEFIERFSARSLSMGTIAPGASGRIEIGISSWTADEDRARLLQVLVDEGSEELVEELRDEQRVGFIRFANTRGWDLHYARVHEVEGGRVIIFATDRPIGYGEAYYNARSLDHNLLVGQLKVPDEGNGDGFLAVGVEVTINKETGAIELENFSSEPLRLSHVQSRKK